MLLKEFIGKGVKALGDVYPALEAGKVISIICEHFLGVKSYTHIVEPGYEVSDRRLPSLEGALARLQKGEPVQYVTGEAPFGELTFKVNPSVLIPRPETEMLVREAINVVSRLQRMRSPFGKNARQVRVLDLCTGSGCIAWSIALGVPGVDVTAVDISEDALAVASGQPFGALLKERRALSPKFVKADILDRQSQFAEGSFDLIISNPPYIMVSQKTDMKANVLEYEPSIALFAPEDDPLSFYRSVAFFSARQLSSEGTGMVEINDELGPQTVQLFRDAGFKEVTLMKDFHDRDRMVKFVG